jgi:type II secretion system protein N
MLWWRGGSLVEKKQKKYLVYGGMVLWFFIVLVVLVYLFFPYQKLARVAFQNFMGGSKMAVSLEDVRVRPFGARAAKVVFGHEALKGKPIFELEGVKISWNPVSLAKGVLTLCSDASAYGGSLNVTIDGIPVILNSNPGLKIAFSNINLAKYPENHVPWFKGISGTLNGWIKQDIVPSAPEKQKGRFSLVLKDGEIKEITTRSYPRLTLPYKSIEVEGRIDGDRITLTKIALNSMGNAVKGTGVIDTNEFDQKVDIKLTYEALAKTAPLAGKGTITVVGNQWSPDIVFTQAGTEPKPGASAQPEKKTPVVVVPPPKPGQPPTKPLQPLPPAKPSRPATR